MSIHERFIDALLGITPTQKRGKWLEDETGVAASKWTQLLLGRQRCTPEMLEAFCAKWPQYSQWVMSGTTGTEQVKIGISPDQIIQEGVREIGEAGSREEVEKAVRKIARAAALNVLTRGRENGDKED